MYCSTCFYLNHMIFFEFLKLFYTSIFIWLSGTAAALALRKKLSFSYQLFAWLIITLSVMLTVAYILAFKNIANHLLFNIFDPLEFFIIPLFYYYHLSNRVIKNIILIYLFIFPIFVLINALLIQNFHQLATNSYVFGAAFTILLSVAYLWQLYTSDDTDSIFRDPVFWISLAYVFYCAVSIPYLGMLNDLWEKHPVFTRKYYFIMYYGAIIINRIFLIAAFVCMNPSVNRS